MTQPLPAPYFGAGYTTPLTDIGSGYAAGITSAGKSLAGAIGSVMGTAGPSGEAQPGLLQQGADAHQTLDMLHQMQLMDDQTYEKLKTSGLGAQQKAIGLFTAKAATQFQAQAEIQKQQLANEAAMARTQVGETGAAARTQAEIAARQRIAELEARTRQQEAEQKKPRLVVPQPPAATPPIGSPIPVPQMKLGI
jgi:hypothetical protein